jgi:hypothetical protein
MCLVKSVRPKDYQTSELHGQPFPNSDSYSIVAHLLGKTPGEDVGKACATYGEFALCML